MFMRRFGTADLPFFRIKDECPTRARLVSRPARGPAVARDEPTYTKMYETRNETARPTRTLVPGRLPRRIGAAGSARPT